MVWTAHFAKQVWVSHNNTFSSRREPFVILIMMVQTLLTQYARFTDSLYTWIQIDSPSALCWDWVEAGFLVSNPSSTPLSRLDKYPLTSLSNSVLHIRRSDLPPMGREIWTTGHVSWSPPATTMTSEEAEAKVSRIGLPLSISYHILIFKQYQKSLNRNSLAVHFTARAGGSMSTATLATLDSHEAQRIRIPRVKKEEDDR